jgi:pyruvate/2-oxoglutarate dehydrogenase complex dihydrolipoamide dehydrogenase (E3) component
MGNDFDLIVIGGGLAGLTAAELAARIGLRTALVEKTALGGEHLSYDVPLTAMHEALQNMQTNALRKHPSFVTLKATGKIAVNKAQRTPAKLREQKVTVANGTAHFVNKTTVAVGEKKLRGRYFIVATGTTPKWDLANIESVYALSPELALQQARAPRELVIVGGGATGVELASLFAATGVKVTVLEKAGRILPEWEPEIAKRFCQQLNKKAGVKFLTGTTAVALRKNGDRKSVLTADDKVYTGDEVIVAMGGVPQLDLGLNNAGVRMRQGKVEMDEALRTTNRRIFAIGSCRGGRTSTARAIQEARLAVTNIAARAVQPYLQYSVVDTLMLYGGELASIGLTEAICEKRRIRYEKFVQDGVKVILSPKGHLLGATVLAPNAELILLPLALAIKTGLPARELSLPTSSLSSNNLLQNTLSAMLKI